jgi:hypothetical protein
MLFGGKKPFFILRVTWKATIRSTEKIQISYIIKAGKKNPVLYSEIHMKSNNTQYGENSDFLHYQSRKKTRSLFWKCHDKQKHNVRGKYRLLSPLKQEKKPVLYSENHMKRKNTMYKENPDFFRHQSRQNTRLPACFERLNFVIRIWNRRNEYSYCTLERIWGFTMWCDCRRRRPT